MGWSPDPPKAPMYFQRISSIYSISGAGTTLEEFARRIQEAPDDTILEVHTQTGGGLARVASVNYYVQRSLGLKDRFTFYVDDGTDVLIVDVDDGVASATLVTRGQR